MRQAHRPGAGNMVEDHEGAERTMRPAPGRKRNRPSTGRHRARRSGSRRPAARSATRRACAGGSASAGSRHGCPRPSSRNRAWPCRPCRRRCGDNRDRSETAHIARCPTGRAAERPDDVVIARQTFSLGAAGHELFTEDANGNAGLAVFAGGTIGDGLRAAEAGMGERVVEPACAASHQMGEHLSLLLARQIGAGSRRRQIKLRRIARLAGQFRSHSSPAIAGQSQTRRNTITPARMSCRHLLSAANRENRRIGGNIQLR